MAACALAISSTYMGNTDGLGGGGDDRSIKLYMIYIKIYMIINMKIYKT